MAQTGNFTPILLYASSTPGNVPLAARLTNSADGSEIAINIADKNLFFKDSGGTVNTVPIRQSGTSSNGWLSSTDWNTFNNKAPATSGSSILYGNGTGGFSNVTIGSGISFSGGTLSATGSGGTVTSVAALTIGTTGTDLSSTVANGTTTPVITLNVPTASATNRGALSSTDWSTFNGKQAALVSGTNIKTVGGVSLLGSGDVGTIGTGYGGTGLTSFTANGILYASSSSVLATGSALTFDGTNLSTTGSLISTKGYANTSDLGLISSANIPGLNLRTTGSGSGRLSLVTSYIAGDTSSLLLGTGTNSPSTEAMRFYHSNGYVSFNASSAGVSIGNTTDPGATNLSVSGKIGAGTAVYAGSATAATALGNTPLQSVGQIWSSQTFTLNSSTPVTIANMTAGIIILRDTTSGGTALVLFENGTGTTIVSQSGTTVFTTGAPSASQIRVYATTSQTIGAITGSGISGHAVAVGALFCQ